MCDWCLVAWCGVGRGVGRGVVCGAACDVWWDVVGGCFGVGRALWKHVGCVRAASVYLFKN